MTDEEDIKQQIAVLLERVNELTNRKENKKNLEKWVILFWYFWVVAMTCLIFNLFFYIVFSSLF